MKRLQVLVLAQLLIPFSAFAAEEGTKATGLAALGLNVGALLFQIINFAILFFLLRKYVYPPILKVLEDRRTRIARSLEDARKAESARDDAEQERDVLLQDARKRAEQLVADAQTQAQERARTIVEDAETRAKAVVERAEADAHQKLQKARTELRAEMRDLVVSATEMVLQEKVDSATDKRVIDAAIKRGAAA